MEPAKKIESACLHEYPREAVPGVFFDKLPLRNLKK